MSEKSPAERLRAARESAGLTQDQAAQRLGVTGKTISRWETGAPVKPKDLSAALMAYEQPAPETESPDKKVPRATSAAGIGLPWSAQTIARLSIRAEEFEWEMVRLGADNDDARLIQDRVKTFLAAIGKRETHDPDGELETYLEFGLRPWVRKRIELRNPPVPIEDPAEDLVLPKPPTGPETNVTPITRAGGRGRHDT